MTATRRTLAQMNEGEPSRRERFGCTLELVRRVGSQGRKGSGTKIHILTCELIVACPESPRKVGKYHMVVAPCNANGQFTGQVHENLDTDAITCQKCIKRVGG